MKKLLLLVIPFLMCACKTEKQDNQENKQIDYSLKAEDFAKEYAHEKLPYEYFYCYSELLKYDEVENTYYYKIYYICYDYSGIFLNYNFIVSITDDSTNITILNNISQ